MKAINLSLADAEKSDLFVFSLGYEPRCTFAARTIKRLPESISFAVGYKHSKLLSYEESADWYRRNGATVVDNLDDLGYREWINQCMATHSSVRSICVDLSSMNRSRIAAWAEFYERVGDPQNFRMHFIYCPSRFVHPSDELIQNENVGPLSARFSGGLLEPGRPPELVLGLGYEVGKALGALEFLQCSDSWVFIPKATDVRFEQAVERVNKILIDNTAPNRLVRYRLDDPAGTYADLCSLLRGISQWSNPILLPLGPKLFSLVCMLAGLKFENSSVWRASQGRYEIPVAREADGQFWGLSIVADHEAEGDVRLGFEMAGSTELESADLAE
jgi:hypothetical protein